MESSRQSRLQRLGSFRPKEFKQDDALVKILVSGDGTQPVTVSPLITGLDLFDWVRKNPAEIENLLYKHGALLFRGFSVSSADEFYAFMEALSGGAIAYTNRSSPRHEVRDKIYTSTDHPRDQVINMHNEHSYSEEWPMKIVFYCSVPPHDGGETPIADSRKVLLSLHPETVGKFQEKHIRYVRHIGTGLGMKWQDVFQTGDKTDVESYCRKKGLDFEWLGKDLLKLVFVKPAIRIHPHTKEAVWFNHAFFFNILSVDPSLRDGLLDEASRSLMPFLTYYGDGTPIEPGIIDEIRACYEKHKIVFPWQQKDILVMDNMLMAHGRNAFTGNRSILVGMSDPVSL